MEGSEARALLYAAEVFFSNEAGEEGHQELNLNDTFGWACADGQVVTDEELPELARLFSSYGYCGALYWTVRKRGLLGNEKWSEFHDINRYIGFVREEEKIREAVPESNKRAYHKASYTLGEPQEPRHAAE